LGGQPRTGPAIRSGNRYPDRNRHRGDGAIQRVDDPENKAVRLYCHSEQGEQKEQGINQRFCERFEAGLKNIADGLGKPRTEKRLDKVHERIGRLKEKSKGIGQHYAIELLPDASGKKAVELRWTKQPQAGTRLTHPGVYYLRSNQTDWDSERLWRTYIMLTDLEAVFRSFKSELGLRPVYHPKEIRVNGHLFITVLAYQFVQIIRKQLQEHDIQGRWSRLREILSVQQRNSVLPACGWRRPAYPQSHASGNGAGGHLPDPEARSLAGRCAKDFRLT
jgi:hypothetical protein